MKKGLLAILLAISVLACEEDQTIQSPFYESATDYNEFVVSLFNSNYEISGLTQGFGNLPRDGYVDFALVMPALSRNNLLYLDIDALISPETDMIKVPMYSFEIPSNITLPDQRENYMIGINFNKPQYRFYVNDSGPYKMVATHGKFPIKKVIDDVRAGKSMFQVINHFQFIQSGSVNVNINQNSSNNHIAVNQTAFNSSMTLKAPQFSPSLAMVSVALRESEGLLSPTDLKNATPGASVALKTTSSNEPKFVASLLRQNDVYVTNSDLYPMAATSNPQRNMNQMSITIQSAEELSQAPEFLPLIERPIIQGEQILLNTPPETQNIAALGTYLSFVEIEDIQKEKMSFEKTTRIWEVIMPDSWKSSILLPTLDYTLKPNRRYRWVVMFLGQNRATKKDSHPLDLSLITHITRNAVDVK